MRKSHGGQWPGRARRPRVGRPGPGHSQARSSGALPPWAWSRGCLAASGPLSAPPTPFLPPCVASSSPKRSMENLMSEFQSQQRMWPDLHLLGSRAEPQGGWAWVSPLPAGVRESWGPPTLLPSLAPNAALTQLPLAGGLTLALGARGAFPSVPRLVLPPAAQFL